MNTLLRSTVPCLLALCLASCTIGFDRDWKKAAASDDTKNRNGLAGAWEGQWQNSPDSHHGKLWAIATPSKPGHYHFRYKATWARIFSGVFETEHAATQKNAKGAYVLSGEKDLGMMGGLIRFSGTATPSEFHAKYDSKANTGAFDLKRPQ